MSEGLRDDLLLMVEHFKEIQSFFEEIKEPEDFVRTKQGKAYYGAIVMHLQAGSEILKRDFQGNQGLFLKYDEIPGKRL